MILYKPQLLLVPSSNGRLFLHSTTFFDTINFKPQGHKVKKKLTKAGVLKVELYIVSDNSFTDEVIAMKCINPVVHHIDLGDLLKVDDEDNLTGSIEAIIYYNKPKEDGRRSNPRRRRGGSTVVRSTTSTTGARPNPKNKD